MPDMSQTGLPQPPESKTHPAAKGLIGVNSTVKTSGGAELDLVSFEPDLKSGVDLLFAPGIWGQASLFFEAASEAATNFGCAAHCLSYEGTGNSTGKKWQSLNGLAANVQAVVNRLKEEDRSVVLVGHSMGSPVVYRTVQNFGTNNIKSVILLAPVQYSGIAKEALKFALQHPLAFLSANVDLRNAVGTPELAQAILYSSAISPERLVELQQQAVTTSYLAYLQLFSRPYGKVKPLDIPLVVMRPESDQNYTRQAIAATAAVLGAEHSIIPGAHQGISEDPAQVIESIIGWLRAKELLRN